MGKDIWMVEENETLDDLILGGLKLIQPRKGYRFSIDAVLLAHFAQLEKVKKAVDLGCGNGVIPFLLAARSPNLQISGIEIQEQMAERARRSVEYNGLLEQVQIITGDYCQVKNYLPPECCELVLSNPPFYTRGQGRVSQDNEEALARHEITMTLDKLIAASCYLLTPGGSLCLVHRCERLPDIINCCTAHRLLPVRLRAVHSFKEQEARLILIEAQKKERGTFKLLPPLAIYERAGVYSKEVKLYYGEDR